MASPFLIVQLSDPHIGARWAEGDPVAGLAAAVGSIRAMQMQPDAVLVTGDLADTAVDSEYVCVRELLLPLRAPVHVVPGNHDDREALRRHFGLPGTAAQPVFYTVDLGPARLVMLDTTIPGKAAGTLDRAQIEWLDEVLTASSEQPTLIAMHHPPLLTGLPPWDEIGLSKEGRDLLAEIVGRHRQVRRIVAGHTHRAIAGELGGRPVLSVPSTYVQSRLRFGSSKLEFAPEPAGFAVHAVFDRRIVSFIQPVV